MEQKWIYVSRGQKYFAIRYWLFAIRFQTETSTRQRFAKVKERHTDNGTSLQGSLKQTELCRAYLPFVSCKITSGECPSRITGAEVQLTPTSTLVEESAKTLNHYGNGRGSRRGSGSKHVPLSENFCRRRKPAAKTITNDE